MAPNSEYKSPTYQKDWYLKNKEAHLSRTKARHQRGKELINSLKENVPCLDCDGIFDPCAMDWHHLNGEDKIFTVSHMRGHSHDKIIEEISKCKLICSNCHRVRHKRSLSL